MNEPETKRWRAADRARRAASAYRANREALEPVGRLLVDVLALAALARRRSAAAVPQGEAGAPR